MKWCSRDFFKYLIVQESQGEVITVFDYRRTQVLNHTIYMYLNARRTG